MSPMSPSHEEKGLQLNSQEAQHPCHVVLFLLASCYY